MLSGDDEAFRTVYRALQPPLLRYLTVLVGIADAEDVASEAWAQAFRDLDRFSGGADGFTEPGTEGDGDFMLSPPYKSSALNSPSGAAFGNKLTKHCADDDDNNDLPQHVAQPFLDGSGNRGRRRSKQQPRHNGGY